MPAWVKGLVIVVVVVVALVILVMLLSDGQHGPGMHG
jgi:preprotein translocase subunit SecG